MNKWLLLAIVFGALLFGFNMIFGWQMFALPTILWALLVVVLLHKFGIFKALPFPDKKVTIFAVIIVVVMLFTGAFTMLFPMIPTFEAGTVASVTTPSTTTTTAVLEGCKAEVGNPKIIGKAATVTVNAYDMASNTPYSAAVDNTAYFMSNGGIVKSTDTSAYSLTGYSVGDVVSVYGGSSSYYLVDEINICIDQEAFPLDLVSYAVAAETNLQITGYDDTGATALSAGTNTTEEDYDITIGADGEETFYAKIKVNVANKAFNLYGIATAVANDIDECEPQDSIFTEVPAPKWLKGINLGNEHGGENLTDTNYDTWVLPEPVLLTEWESKKYQLNFKASSTDPATSTTFSTQDMCVLCFFDAIWERGDDGNLYLDFYKHDSGEADVGLAGLVTAPAGKASCTIIEGI